jgi:hypothetical protein
MPSKISLIPLPPPRPMAFAKPAATQANRGFALCSTLLRQMYALDLEIWSMEGCIEEEIPRREELMRKANDLFIDIRMMVNDWVLSPSDQWSNEEREKIREIWCVLDKRNPRYLS